jgi:hypothetical protein
MVVSSAGHGPENDCSGKAQKQVYKQIRDPSSRQRECPTSRNPQLSERKEKSGHELQMGHWSSRNFSQVALSVYTRMLGNVHALDNNCLLPNSTLTIHPIVLRCIL